MTTRRSDKFKRKPNEEGNDDHCVKYAEMMKFLISGESVETLQ